MMRLTTIGTGTISLSPTRSCSGYLVERGDVRLLLDCGSGVARRLAELALDWPGITHVAISHFHLDHHADLPTLIFAWKYGLLPPRSAPIEIIGPPGLAQLFERLGAAHGPWLTAPGFPVIVRELTGDPIPLAAGFDLSSQPVPHTAESVAYSLSAGGRRLVYTGDTGPSAALGDWAAGCDVLVSECSLPDAMAIPEHLTPAQCGTLAARAGTNHLVLSHFYPPVEAIDIVGEVRASYAGPVTLAHDGWSIEIEEG